jgi:hypothetical protein
VLTTANATGTNGLTCLSKHGGARNNKFLDTHPMTDQRCLACCKIVLNWHCIRPVFLVPHKTSAMAFSCHSIKLSGNHLIICVTVTFLRTLARNRNKDDVICYAEICYGVSFGAINFEHCMKLSTLSCIMYILYHVREQNTSVKSFMSLYFHQIKFLSFF